MEQWKPIPDFEHYEISNLGRVRSVSRVVPHTSGGSMKLRGKLMRLRWSKVGKCYFLDICNKHRRITAYPHKEIARAFVPNDDPEQKVMVIHLDNNSRNNHSDNLQWVTRSDHMKWHFQVGNKNNHKVWKIRKKRYANGFKPDKRVGRRPKQEL